MGVQLQSVRPPDQEVAKWFAQASAMVEDDCVAGTLQFSVIKARINWGTYFRDLLKPIFGGAASESIGFEGYSGRGLSVVAKNSSGETRVIAVFKEPREAKHQAAVIEQDFKSLRPDEWCERYDVPPVFVSG
jgi:hypothetical protein